MLTLEEFNKQAVAPMVRSLAAKQVEEMLNPPPWIRRLQEEAARRWREEERYFLSTGF